MVGSNVPLSPWLWLCLWLGELARDAWRWLRTIPERFNDWLAVRKLRRAMRLVDDQYPGGVDAAMIDLGWTRTERPDGAVVYRDGDRSVVIRRGGR